MKKKTVINLVWQIILVAAVVGLDRAVKLYIISNCRTGEVFG